MTVFKVVESLWEGVKANRAYFAFWLLLGFLALRKLEQIRAAVEALGRR